MRHTSYEPKQQQNRHSDDRQKTHSEFFRRGEGKADYINMADIHQKTVANDNSSIFIYVKGH